jgi:hypothetical protein
MLIADTPRTAAFFLGLAAWMLATSAAAQDPMGSENAGMTLEDVAKAKHNPFT